MNKRKKYQPQINKWAFNICGLFSYKSICLQASVLSCKIDETFFQYFFNNIMEMELLVFERF